MRSKPKQIKNNKSKKEQRKKKNKTRHFFFFSFKKKINKKTNPIYNKEDCFRIKKFTAKRNNTYIYLYVYMKDKILAIS